MYLPIIFDICQIFNIVLLGICILFGFIVSMCLISHFLFFRLVEYKALCWKEGVGLIIDFFILIFICSCPSTVE